MTRVPVGAAAAFLLFCANAAVCAAPQARVESGVLEGSQLGKVRAFLGVPYAAPPVGHLRWLAPAAPAEWQGVRSAREFESGCMQSPRGPFGPYTREFVEQPTEAAEDCLYLNIWTPAVSTGDELPVLVWIHGGAFIGGSSSVPIYDGRHLAESGIVVVSVNYRLGAFGFFSSPELREQQPEVAGLQGIHDGVAALHWLHRNATAFGGDAGRITIAGQSAGAAAVNILLLLEEARGLFSGAISQSMPLGGVELRTVAEGDDFSGTLLRGFAAHTLGDLRRVPAEDILRATELVSPGPMRPILNEEILPAQLPALAERGRLAPVPILAGVVVDESRFGGSLLEYRTLFAGRYGTYANEFLKIYPASNREQAIAAAARAGEDRLLMGLRQFSAWSSGPAYLYVWGHVPPPPEAARHGAFHSSEIPYVFGTLDAAPERGYSDADRAISRALMDYWSAFVKSGDPNFRGLAPWPPADAGESPVMRLGDEWAPTTRPSAERASFFRAFFEAGGSAFLN